MLELGLSTMFFWPFVPGHTLYILWVLSTSKNTELIGGEREKTSHPITNDLPTKTSQLVSRSPEIHNKNPVEA